MHSHRRDPRRGTGWWFGHFPRPVRIKVRAPATMSPLTEHITQRRKRPHLEPLKNCLARPMMEGMLTFHPATFAYPDDFRAAWHPTKPDFASAANAVSLLMPYAEPYVVRSIKAVTDRLEPDLRAEALAYARQEGQHHAQHRRFNELLIAEQPVLRHNERLMAWVYGNLERRASAEFGVAFSAGFETIAYTAARWVDHHRSTLLLGAEPVARDLFLWHLAEEVEHKSVAYDVHSALGSSKARYATAMILSFALLAFFAFVNTMTLLATSWRILNPFAHLRLLFWSITFAFDLLPAMAISALPGHHPNDLVDPLFYCHWLNEQRAHQVNSLPD